MVGDHYSDTSTARQLALLARTSNIIDCTYSSTLYTSSDSQPQFIAQRLHYFLITKLSGIAVSMLDISSKCHPQSPIAG